MTSFRLAVDIGGTFTDAVLERADRTLITVKTPTTPEDPVVGAMLGVRQVLDKANVALSQVGRLVHGTTLATNTLIEKKGARVGALLTSGFRDILEIGYERRYNQDDLFIDKPDLLVPREYCLTVSERLSADGTVIEPLDDRSLQNALATFNDMEVESIAVCLLHAYANPQHEQDIAAAVRDRHPHLHVSLSSGVSPEVREFDRLCTTVADAYIKPLMASYLDRFEQALAAGGFIGSFYVMTSAGGMTTVGNARQFPIRLVESGPSGGAILAARLADRCGMGQIVSFDMGGTTAKFCMIDNGKPLTSRLFEAARAERFIKGSGMPLRIPAIEMIEIGAGGGSVASVDTLSRITVGPKSMGADPGPACFKQGGAAATVTDADLLLGYIQASSFAQGRLTLDDVAARYAIAKAVGIPLDLDVLEAAHGISRMVSENMANAGRVHAAERGTGLAQRTMIAFGGNGPLHATRVAQTMGVSKIVIPTDPGVGSAVGFLSAPVSYEIVSSLYTTLDKFDFAGVNHLLGSMAEQARAIVNAGDTPIAESRVAYMRYAGQGHEIEVALPSRFLCAEDLPALAQAYDDAYRKQFKRIVPGMNIEVMNWAVTIEQCIDSDSPVPAVIFGTRPKPSFHKPVYYGETTGRLDTPVYIREDLNPGDVIDGPALIVEPQTSTLVEAKWCANIDGSGNILLILEDSNELAMHAQPSRLIDQQLMWNRLLSVVEEQAQALIRSAFSPIVRECGDISAGIFDRDGRMLAQAVTGTPGHINTMAGGVANFLEYFPISEMKPGDIYVTNDPWLAAGHLNDFMLVQPVFMGDTIVGFTSCTSHLVDVGGLCMGPMGSDIYDEGLIVPPFRLVADGVVDRLLLDLVKANSRRPIENEGDLYALIACCEVGASRLLDMMGEYGLTALDSLAGHIIESSRQATIAAIRELPDGDYESGLTLDGYDFEIELKAKLTIAKDSMVLDFEGSSPCSRFGINVPLNYAAAYSVFAIRCVVGNGVPNNAGSLAPFKVLAPQGCIVNARHPAPVAMRHTVGQLLPDLVLGCLHKVVPDRVPAEGASCMYDLPMRNVPATQKSRFAIELVHNGGTGARPDRDGLSATAYPSGVWGSQVEVTECTVPLRVARRELRTDSGGAGRYRGGLGQTIEIESVEDADFLLFLSLDRIKFPALGRSGGQAGMTGEVRLSSGKILPGRGEEVIPRGERLIFQTPGGGGNGDPFKRLPEAVRDDVRRGLVTREIARNHYGVVVDESHNLNLAATCELRERGSC